jgi:putative ABC transport system ATP-binding protein
MADSHVIIETIDLTKVYGMGDIQVLALDGLSMTINAGEFVAIMGPSGSGKSTLMNIIGCLDRPSTGKYILDGEDVSDMSRGELATIRNQKLGFVFQSYNLLPRLNAVENVVLPLMYNRENRMGLDERHEKAMAALENVGLAERSHHLPRELSGGQQQRVAIARALINDPVLVLADEPTGNLDTKSSYEIMDLLHTLHEKGSTIVMVTHEPDIAAQTERSIHIRDGKLELDNRNGHNAAEAKRVMRESLQAAQEGDAQ